MASKKSTGTTSGGCLCGAVRYESAAAPKFTIHCYCRKCQRLTGAGHASSLSLPVNEVSITGKLSTYELTADSGSTVTNSFCRICGSPVMKATLGYPEIVFFHAGSLDDPSQFKAQHNVWASQKQPWDQIDPDVPSGT